jgi:hypothetical protein
MLKFNQLTGHVLAAAAVALLGIGLIGRVAAQDDDADSSPPAKQAEENVEAPPTAETGPADDTQNNADQAKPETPAENQQADDAPPDDLQFDDNIRREDTDPPALPSDNNARDDRRDTVRNDVQNEDGRANTLENGVSPSDRTFDRVDNDRNDVRRFDYDDPSQPIPEEQARTHQGNGCHPCGQRVYHNPCGGCGRNYGYRQWNGNSWNGAQQYQTQNQQPNRRVIGVTISDDDGIHVASVVPNGPAAQAGVQGGDRIVAIDGVDVHESQAFMDHLRRSDASDSMTLTIARGGEQHQFDVQSNTYAQVFGRNRQRASEVPEPPQNLLVRRNQPRVAFRPNYEAAVNDDQRLERVQQRIGQLERELVALRKEEQDMQNTLDNERKESDQTEPQESDIEREVPADEAAPTDASPAPADDSSADDNADSTEPPTSRERLSPSAR